MSDKLASRGPRQLSGRIPAPGRRERWSASGIAGFSLEELKLPESSREELPSVDRTSRIVAIAPRAMPADGTAEPSSVAPPPPAKHSKVLLGLFVAGCGAVLFIALGGSPAVAPPPPVEAAPARQPIAAEARNAGSVVPVTPPILDASSRTSVTPGPVVTAPLEPPEQVVLSEPPGPRKAARRAAAAAGPNSVLERPIAPPDD